MSLFRKILLSTLAVLSAAPLFAQKDTLFTVNREIVIGGVRTYSAKEGLLKVVTEKEKSLKLPSTYISSIHFTDGFHMDWLNGSPVRDNLLDAPTIRFDMENAYVEGLIKLTKPEMQMLFGPVNYYTEIIPCRVLFWKGLTEFVIGGLGGSFGIISEIIHIAGNNPDLDVTQAKFRYPGKGLWCYATDAGMGVYGTINPNSFLGVAFALSSLGVGLADLGISLYRLKHLKDERDAFTPRSLTWSKTEFIGGCALAATGVTLLSVGYVDLLSHTKTVEPPSMASHWLLLGGAIAAEAGLSLALVGSIRLHGYKMNLTPTPGGLALSCQF